MTIDLQVALNSIATYIRDQADLDYISARAIWRLQFRDQFLWQELQCVEKYAKAILLFNGKSARFSSLDRKRKEFGHDLLRLLKEIDSISDLTTAFPEWFPAHIGHLSRFGPNRYLTRGADTGVDALERLDYVVWNIRRYCEDLRWQVDTANGIVDLFPRKLAELNSPDLISHPYRHRLAIGQLERILEKPEHDIARTAFVWRNCVFVDRTKESARGSSLVPNWRSSAEPLGARPWLQDPVFRRQIEYYFKLS